MLVFDSLTVSAIFASAWDAIPLEMCGLLAGPAGGDRVAHFYPCRNAARSARVYAVDSKDFLRADRDSEKQGWEILGVVHSHTHTPAYPSPTDVSQAPDPAWHYAIVSLCDGAAVLRSYAIESGAAGNIVEEAVVVING